MRTPSVRSPPARTSSAAPLKTNEAIGQIAKSQFEAQAKDVTDKVAQAANAGKVK